MNAKDEGLYKKTNTGRIHREQRRYTEELVVTKLEAKIIELSKFLKDTPG